MTDRFTRVAVLLLAIGFAVSPLLSNGFGGFYRESFPVQVARWPAQPAGWAFSIWGLIYLCLIAAAARAVIRPKATPMWRGVAPALGISLFLGLFWIEAAMRSPLVATAMIVPMAAMAIVAMLRAGPSILEWGPLGLYAGWLTAASGVAVSVVLTGYGLASPQVAAIGLILAVLAVTIAVAAKRLRIWTYRAGVGWALIGIIAANARAGDWLIVALCIIGIGVLAALDRVLPPQNATRSGGV